MQERKHIAALNRALVAAFLEPGGEDNHTRALRQYLQTAGNGRTIVGELAEFVARLHHKGIYFRSLHLGNILRHPEGELMLIDVADLRFLWLLMSPLGRARNFRHLFRYPQDLAIIRHYGLKRFLARYLLSSGISPWSAKVLLSRLMRTRPEGDPG